MVHRARQVRRASVAGIQQYPVRQGFRVLPGRQDRKARQARTAKTVKTDKTVCPVFLAHKVPQGQFQPFLDLLGVRDQRAQPQPLRGPLEAKVL